MYLPWIIYVKNDSCAYYELNRISLFKCMRLNIVSESGAAGVLQFGIKAKVSTLSLDGPVERSLD